MSSLEGAHSFISIVQVCRRTIANKDQCVTNGLANKYIELGDLQHCKRVAYVIDGGML